MAEGARGLPPQIQLLIFLGLLIGFGVKMPIFPLHGWLPLAHVEAPSPVSILLSGILLKMGSYGLIRAVETAARRRCWRCRTGWRHWPSSACSTAASSPGASATSRPWWPIPRSSHMGVVLLGIATLNVAGLTGAVMQMVAHGLVAGALFLLIGLLYERTHTRDIARLQLAGARHAALCLLHRPGLRRSGRPARHRRLRRRTARPDRRLRALGRLGRPAVA